MYGSCGVPRACRAIPDPWFLLSLQKGPVGNNLGKFYWHTKGTLKVHCERCVAPSILSTPCHAGPRHHTATRKTPQPSALPHQGHQEPRSTTQTNIACVAPPSALACLCSCVPVEVRQPSYKREFVDCLMWPILVSI